MSNTHKVTVELSCGVEDFDGLYVDGVCNYEGKQIVEAEIQGKGFSFEWNCPACAVNHYEQRETSELTELMQEFISE